MFHALSRVVCDSEQLSRVFRLLIAYAAVNYKDVLIGALQHVFPSNTWESHVCKANTLIVHALRFGTWGFDFHLFPLSLLLDRLIFANVFFYTTDENCVRTLTLADIDDVHVFAQPLLQVQGIIYSGAAVCIEPSSCQVVLQHYHTYH